MLIETLKSLSSDLCWWSCNIFSTQERTVDVIAHDESTAVFSWKGESLEGYWGFIMNALIYAKYYGKGHRPDLIVYDGGDMNIPIHEGKKAEGLFLKDGTIPNRISTKMLSSRFSKPSSSTNWRVER